MSWYQNMKTGAITSNPSGLVESLKIWQEQNKPAKRRVNKFKALHDAVYPKR